MIVNEFPDRVIQIEGEDFLYFGGTNFLGMTTHKDFQNILFESIKKWGTAFGSSRNANIQLSAYDTAEKLLAKNFNSETSVTVSSGMLAGKLVVDYLSKTTDALFHFPDIHPALRHPQSMPILIDGKLNKKIFDETLSKITVLTDAVPSQFVEPADLSILLTIPKEKQIELIIDESYSFGIIENDWQKQYIANNINITKIASLGKAIGLSGGVIAGKATIISGIRNQNCWIGASGMNPAFLETYCKAQPIYDIQKKKLKRNIEYITTYFTNNSIFTFHPSYPIIYFDDQTVSEKFIAGKIITTSFKYSNSSGKLNRIIITANHTLDDLKQLISSTLNLS